MYTNQKSFKFVNSPKDSTTHYSRYTNDDLIKAQLTLSDSAFRLYIYIGMFKEMDTFVLSRKDAMQKTGISNRSYTNAMHELQKHGYVQPSSATQEDNKYIFVDKGT